MVGGLSQMLTLEKFSIGVGDRFAHQAKAQLRACQLIAADGADVVPVWNKSNREHTFIGSEPASVREAASVAVSMPFAPDTFDLIWCSNTINHLINPLETVSHFKALLRANGRLVIGQSGFLPEMFFAWDARLEREVMLANRRYYRDKYGLSEQSMSNYRSWFGLLREAGFTQVTAKTITIERTMPLTHNDEVYFIECVFNGYWAHRVKPYLSQEDWQELQDLCDPQSPKFCLKRRDFHHIQTYTIVIGSIVRQ